MFSKQGKSKRGHWTPEQYEYAQMAMAGGCLACKLGHGTESEAHHWHHIREGFHGIGMRPPHHYGLPLCYAHHLGDKAESIHQNPEGFRKLIGMTEAQAVEWCWNRFGWGGQHSNTN